MRERERESNLGTMHIHLISVKVSVVRGGTRQIHPERGVGQNFHPDVYIICVYKHMCVVGGGGDCMCFHVCV